MSTVSQSAPPLAGIRVLDLSNLGPGARCSRILADLGAAVTRVVPPAGKGGHRLELPFHSYNASRGWRKLAIDMKQARGREILLRLMTTADVVIEGFRPGVAARLGIGYEDAARANARVVYCSISGYGQSGPAANWVGHDLNYAAMAGMLATGQPRADGAPAIPGLTVADNAGGMQAAVAILAALLRRGDAGTGSYLDVAMTDGMLYLMSMQVDEYLATDTEPTPGSSVLSGRYACYDLYPTGDGKWLSVAAIETGFFAKLCKALGCEEWIPHQFDDAKQDEIRSTFRRILGTRGRDAWVALLGPLDTCVAPVNSIADTTRDPHLTARALFAQAQHPEHGGIPQVGRIFPGADRSERSYAVPSASGTDSEAILAEISITGDEFAALKAEGIVG